MKLSNIRKQTKTGVATWGCAWEKGECFSNTGYICKNHIGKEVPLQSRVTAFWPDGSVKWTAHSANATLLGNSIEVLPLKENCDKNNDCNIKVQKSNDCITVDTDFLSLSIDKKSNSLFDYLLFSGKKMLQNATAELIIEKHLKDQTRKDVSYTGQITKITVEEQGPVQVIINYQGIHQAENGETLFPFIIRMTVNQELKSIRFTHTFIYDGDEDTDFLKGIGVRFDAPLKGAMYNRHIKFTNDTDCFHESVVPLISWRPRIPQTLYQRQTNSECLILSGEDKAIVDTVLLDTPYWSEYDFCQDSASHYLIKKKLKEDNCCYIDALHGTKTIGGCSFGSEHGSVIMAIRDFWEKYPSGYTIKNLDGDKANATMWFYSPSAQPFDFRHYANRGYNQVCYEGYDYKGATPKGIACTSECTVEVLEDIISSDKKLYDFAQTVNSPTLYVASPEYYHNIKAFGYWSLPYKNTEMEIWLENQLESAVNFYLNEVKQRNWYGIFNYGDFMHTYDKYRHQWRYDIGGFAWDNTELVPTIWLWLYFMRTGREDVFTLAEKLSRHTSEVDVYHLGVYKGLGSRHNVRHWGCPCKEARIAMAGHHRYYYYLTGDRRFEDIFEELKDNETAFYNKDPLGDFYDKEKMIYPTHARTGPDWSSLCSNWMTQWERTNDILYKEKIEIGLKDIEATPLKLSSGPDFEFDPKSLHLRYIGERTTGGYHLQVCMGAPQIWFEIADLLEDDNFKSMLAQHGRFYYLSHEEQLKESNGIIGDREASLPYMAAAMSAYGAKSLNLSWLSDKTWKILLNELIFQNGENGFKSVVINNCANNPSLSEIPFISTNFAAQWCLNVIMALCFIRESLPKTYQEALELIANGNKDK